MEFRRFESLLAGAAMLAALSACMQSEPKNPREDAPGAPDNPVRQVSAQMSKPYLLNARSDGARTPTISISPKSAILIS